MRSWKCEVLGILIGVMLMPVVNVRADEADPFAKIAASLEKCRKEVEKQTEEARKIRHELNAGRPDRKSETAAENTLAALDQVMARERSVLRHKPTSASEGSEQVKQLTALSQSGRALVQMSEAQIHPSNVLERGLHVLGRVTGYGDIGTDNGVGGGSSSLQYDGARRKSVRASSEVVVRGGTVFFAGGRASAAPTSSYTPVTEQVAKDRYAMYGSIPQGVALEGVARNLGENPHVSYDRTFNALTLDDRAVYFLKVPGSAVAVLCRAIAADYRARHK